MTREEEEYFRNMLSLVCAGCTNCWNAEKCKECLFSKLSERAIEALKEQRPHGEWIYEYDDFYHCSICGDVICTQWDELSLKKYFPFCHCGADMRKEGEKNDK